jgi:hypothetical protein
MMEIEVAKSINDDREQNYRQPSRNSDEDPPPCLAIIHPSLAEVFDLTTKFQLQVQEFLTRLDLHRRTFLTPSSVGLLTALCFATYGH